MFLEPLEKTTEEVQQMVNNGRFPPCILYKIIYTGLEENRVKSALVNIVLHGTNVPLSFSCRVKEEMCECGGLCVPLYSVCVCACTPV